MARFGLLPVAFLLLPACAGQSMFPLDIEQQIDPTLSFAQVKEAPASHLGKVIVLAGEILDATRHKEHTRLTVLQLPTIKNHQPAMDRTMSQGRFMAFQTEFLDPATVPNGTRITVVGKVTGETTELLDEMDYKYPTVTIQFLKVWPEAMQLPPRYGRYGFPSYYGYPYWYGGPLYAGSYWAPYYGIYRPFPFGFW
ncbi:MAG: Slp family lipoprotein [Nitrospira sp.]|nr:Slp family lipoprotein [Nitrospira sp.]